MPVFRPRRSKRVLKRRVRRIRNVSRVSRAVTLRQPVHFYKRVGYTPAWFTTSNIADSFQSLAFNLNSVPSAGDFTALYDSYCIKAVKVKLIPRFNVSTVDTATAGAPVGSTISQVMSVIDYDDSNALTSVASATEYQSLKMTRGNVVHKRYLVPKIAYELFNTGITTAYGQRSKQWIDAAYPSATHYGVKFAFPQTTVPVTYDLYVTYYLGMRQVR